MKYEEFEKVREQLHQERIAVQRAKNKDYSTEEDCLSNFKEMAKRMGATPEQILAVYLDKHYTALLKYIRGGCKDDGSEPIVGRIHDAMNYLDMLYALQVERQQTEKMVADQTADGRIATA